MRILIAGGTGFIGSAVIRHLISNTRHHVINLDKLTAKAHPKSLGKAARSVRYQFHQADICDPELFSALLNQHQPDVLLNLATLQPETSYNGTRTLLEVIQGYWQDLSAAKQQSFRLHHLSCHEVHGEPDTLIEPLTETSPYAPATLEAASKASVDHLMRSWHLTHGLPISISSSSGNYGCCQFPDQTIPSLLIRALKEQPLYIHGDGQQTSDWLHVADHARALHLLLSESKVNETYMIGCNQPTTQLELVCTLCDLLDELHPANTSYRNLITYDELQPTTPRHPAVDSSKIQQQLGWLPQETFHSGLRKTVEWYLNNTEWWQSIIKGEYRQRRLGKGGIIW